MPFGFADVLFQVDRERGATGADLAGGGPFGWGDDVTGGKFDMQPAKGAQGLHGQVVGFA